VHLSLAVVGDNLVACVSVGAHLIFESLVSLRRNCILWPQVRDFLQEQRYISIHNHVYIYVCMHVCMYIHIYVYMIIYRQMHISIYIYLYI
jgi:hypothetical protein